MGRVKPVDVLGVRVEMPTNQPIVLLRERNGERYLPIWIGAAEATAIAYAQQGVEPPRPLTHDLLKEVIETTRAPGHPGPHRRAPRQGVLRDPRHRRDDRDQRPSSDAIALALRTDTEIVVAEAVLDEAGVALTPEEDDEVEKFREFLDQVSAEDFENPNVDPQVDPGDEGTPRET